MKIVTAPDSFKESMSAEQACAAMERGVVAVFPDAEVVAVPMADGGEGTVDALVAGLGGDLRTTSVVGPMGEPTQARWGWVPDERLAIVEIAEAAGIHLVPREARDPRVATTAGVGELLDDVLSHSPVRLIVGLGGSVTNDGGAGMLAALGASILDADGRPVSTAAELGRVATVDLAPVTKRFAGVRLDVACDVSNPLLGEEGATATFGPQKGATPEMVAELDTALSGYAKALATSGADVAEIPGAGAAGGLGAAFLALGASLRPGIEIVIETTDLAGKMAGADYVLTGEGSMDEQTLRGKTPYGVAKAASEQGVKVLAFAGRLGEGSEVLLEHGFTELHQITEPGTPLPEALAQGAANLERAVREAFEALSQDA